jgi:hypothetical protein
MVDKNTLRKLAESERMMDAGLVPFVWAKNIEGRMERLAVAAPIMEDLGLVQGQTVNSILVDAIAAESIKLLTERLEQITQDIYDEMLTDDFDFRKEMGNDSDD